MAVVATIKGATGTPGYTAEIAILKYTIDIASLATDAQADTTVTATGEVTDGDFVQFLSGPAALEKVVVQECHTVTADSFKMRVLNPTAGTVDAASGAFTFLRIRP
jgi:hypothetical protein